MLIDTKLIRFPKYINGYKFYQFYNPIGYSNRSKFALYRNKGGKFGFGKMIVSTDKIWEKYWLKNEQNIYPILNKFSSNSTMVSAPKLVGAYKGNAYTVLLFDLVKAKTLENFGTYAKLKVIDEILNYIEEVNALKIFEKEKMTLISRDGRYFLMLFPYFALLSFIRHPEIRNLMRQIVSQYFSSFWNVIKNRNIKFIHRDLNDANILVANKNIWIIDFQSSIIADYRFEITNIAINMWKDKLFRDAFYGLKSVKRALPDMVSIQIYKFYSLYAALFEISGRRKRVRSWMLSYLNHSLTLSLSVRGEIYHE